MFRQADPLLVILFPVGIDGREKTWRPMLKQPLSGRSERGPAKVWQSAIRTARVYIATGLEQEASEKHGTLCRAACCSCKGGNSKGLNSRYRARPARAYQELHISMGPIEHTMEISRRDQLAESG
jgi:hypothetical protein